MSRIADGTLSPLTPGTGCLRIPCYGLRETVIPLFSLRTPPYGSCLQFGSSNPASYTQTAASLAALTPKFGQLQGINVASETRCIIGSPHPNRGTWEKKTKQGKMLSSKRSPAMACWSKLVALLNKGFHRLLIHLICWIAPSRQQSYQQCHCD